MVSISEGECTISQDDCTIPQEKDECTVPQEKDKCTISKDRMDLYTKTLRDELKPAMGCTEPIAIAYCSATAVKILGRPAERFVVRCSGNMIKNTKAVTVPQTGGLIGIEAAVVAGAVGGDAEAQLQVLAGITPEITEKIQQAVKELPVKVELLKTTHNLHIIVEAIAGEDRACVEIIDNHTGLGNITRNGEILRRRNEEATQQEVETRSVMTVKEILAYADAVDLDQVRDVLETQISYNSAIAREGLENHWGASVGSNVLTAGENSNRARIIARAAAGSDARMNGCSLPVIINSGSGNQGITASMPLVEYASQKDIDHEKLLRGLCVSNLIAIHEKTNIGRMSAFCGAVGAATGAAAGIAYLDGASYEIICRTIVNSIATDGGMVCDGAKSSCASKIATALDCALLGYTMAKNGCGFLPGEGLVMDDVEETIRSVGRMAAKGMRSTDEEILNIMIGN